MSELTHQNEIREKILKSAEDCFSVKGYKETRISDIAENAGISPGTIYNYFKGKKDLFQSLDIQDAENIRPEFEKKKEHILQTALLLFGENGYDGVTMDDIAGAIGLSKASIYQYCSSKEDLFSQILQNSTFNIFTHNMKAATDKASIRETISSLGLSYLRISDFPERVALFKSVIRDSAKFPQLGALYYEQGIKASCANILEYISSYCASINKPVQNSKNLETFIYAYIGTLQSYILMHDIICGISNYASREDYLNITTTIFFNFLEQNGYI
jgi:TetR/AcrR family transcriptional regulator, mexJK operon transcriptional repressor